MDKVKINRDELLTAIKENKEKHIKEFNEAMEGYFVELNEKIDELKDQAMKKENIHYILNVMKPVSHEKDYIRVIRMLEMSVDDVVELTSDQFEEYVLDEWDWKSSWSATTSYYNSKVR